MKVPKQRKQKFPQANFAEPVNAGRLPLCTYLRERPITEVKIAIFNAQILYSNSEKNNFMYGFEYIQEKLVIKALKVR